MKVENTYPTPKKSNLFRSQFLSWVKWPFLAAAVACPIINICTGGVAWSVVTLWSLYMVWTRVIALDMVEFNRISQFIKSITQICVLLILIDSLLSPGWAVLVVPIVCFGGLVVSSCLFFTDIRKQRQNMMPMLLLCIVSLICSVVGLFALKVEHEWTLIVLASFSFCLLVACFSVVGSELFRLLKKHFNAK